MVKGKCIAVVAAIDQREGLIHFLIRERSIKKEDFMQFMTELKAKCPEQLTLFLDNCSVHKANVTKAKFLELDQRPHWNLPYRPDLNCIELFWSQNKRIFRKKLLQETLRPTGKSLE